MPFALTPDGLNTQTQQDVVDELAAKVRGIFGGNTPTSTTSAFGQLINIFSELRAFDQQVVLDVYQMFDPNSAEGIILDRLALITGSIRKGAKVSVVDGLMTFTAAGVANNGDLVNNDDNETVWEVVGGPYVAAGPGDIAVTLQAVIAGPTLANANTNWSLITAITNATDFNNPTDDAALGRFLESDIDFRRRRGTELFSRNVGPLGAIRGTVSKVDGVDTVRAYHNPATFPVDANNIPFKAFLVALETTPAVPGAALVQAIGEAIYAALGAGGEAFGTEPPVNIVDSEGEIQPVSYELISQKNIYIKTTIITAGTEQLTTPAAEIIKVVNAAILDAGTTLFRDIGRNQLAFEYEGVVAALKQSGQISGVTSVICELSDTSVAGPFTDPVDVGILERPNFETVQIITVVDP